MTISESIKVLEDKIIQTEEELLAKPFGPVNWELNLDEWRAILNVVAELKQIQETILKLGWEKIGSGN